MDGNNDRISAFESSARRTKPADIDALITTAADWWQKAVTHIETGLFAHRQYSDAKAPARLRDEIAALLGQEHARKAQITDLTVDYQPIRLLEDAATKARVHVLDFPAKTVMVIRWYNGTVTVNDEIIYPLT